MTKCDRLGLSNNNIEDQHETTAAVLPVFSSFFPPRSICAAVIHQSVALRSLPPVLLLMMIVVAGPHNLRSFPVANSTQNYFLIARMLSFFVTFATKYRLFAKKNETMFDLGNG